MSDNPVVFVFGSNLAGIHGAGSALTAVRLWGAQEGLGVGPAGRSYAIPTKDCRFGVLPVETIKLYVDQFIRYAEEHPNITFKVVKIGCGLAGFTEDEMRPLFDEAPYNCDLPPKWGKHWGITVMGERVCRHPNLGCKGSCKGEFACND